MKRKIMSYDDNIMMLYIHFEKGGVGVRHAHFHSQTSFVLSGKFEVKIGDETNVFVWHKNSKSNNLEFPT